MCDNIKNLIYLNLNSNFSFKKIFNLLAPFFSQFLYLLNISNIINYKSLRNNNKYIIANFIIDVISIAGIFSNILDNKHLNNYNLSLLFILFIIFLFIIPYILFSFLLKKNKIYNLVLGIIIIYLQILGYKLFYCLFKAKTHKHQTKNITKVIESEILNLPEYINIDLNESKEINIEIEGNDDVILDSEITSDNIVINPDWFEIDNINKKIILKSANETGFYNVKLILNSNISNKEYEFLIIRSNKRPNIEIPKYFEIFDNEYKELNLNLEDDSVKDVEINIKIFKDNIILDPTWFIFDRINNKIIFDQVPSNSLGSYKIHVDINDEKDDIHFLEVIDVVVKKR